MGRHGIKPSVHLLNLVISSLRKPVPTSSRFRDTSSDDYWIRRAVHEKSNKHLDDDKFRYNSNNEVLPILLALNYESEGFWDARTFRIFQEGIRLGLLPPFILTR